MKTALITGASSGIGEAFARRLAAEGHDIFLVARTEEKLQALCNELTGRHGIKADHLAVDLGKTGSEDAVFDTITDRGITVDILINNAGFGSMGDFSDLPLERELEMVDLNIRALVGLTHKFVKGMRERKGGTIVNVSSAASFQPIPFMATYAATKAFVTSFSEAIAEENRPFGIQVLALCPGSTETNFFEASKIDRMMQVKGQQTVDEVIETAIAAMNGKRTKIVSGWTNWLVATASNFSPNFVITRAIAKGLRGRYQGDK